MVFIKHFQQIVLSLPMYIFFHLNLNKSNFNTSICKLSDILIILRIRLLFDNKSKMEHSTWTTLKTFINWSVFVSCRWKYKGQRLSDITAKFYGTKLINILFFILWKYKARYTVYSLQNTMRRLILNLNISGIKRK